MTATTRAVVRAVWATLALILLSGIAIAVARWSRPATDPLEPARTAYAQGNWDRVLGQVRDRVKSSATADPEAWRLYARALARLGRDESAAAIYKDRLGEAAMLPEDHFLMGLALVRAGKLELALGVWQKAMRAGPDFPEMLDHIARLSFRLERLDESAEAARKLTDHRGWEAKGWLLLGQVEALLDNPAASIQAITKGLDYDPEARGLPFDAAYYRLLLARMLLESGRPSEAEAALGLATAANSAAAAEPTREASWLASRAFLRQGKISEATAALARAGTYRADHPLVPDPGPFVGSKECAGCHAEEYRKYSATRHNKTFHKGADLLQLPIPDHPLTDPDNTNVTHSYVRTGDKIQVDTRAGEKVYKTIVEYAFGTRDRYISMIGHDDNRDFRALRLSYYRDGDRHGWTRTFGSPTEDELVRGQMVLMRDGVNRCLYCHTTRSRDFREPADANPSPAVADPGIGCERCHGPGTNHIAAIKFDFPDRATVNVGSSTAANINKQCADCHVVGSRAEIEADPENPMYVRSSGVTFTMSRCYSESDGRLSCLTCHDPHTDSEKSAGYYESKCLKCHSMAGNSLSEAVRVVVCPVNPKTKCLECHMKKVDVPVLKTLMTDHFIRIDKSAKSVEPSPGGKK
jgi:tetratricopeptide (TPR) repeat protein